jgi:hypothetical protein
MANEPFFSLHTFGLQQIQDCLHFGDFYVHFTTKQKKKLILHYLTF